MTNNKKDELIRFLQKRVECELEIKNLYANYITEIFSNKLLSFLFTKKNRKMWCQALLLQKEITLAYKNYIENDKGTKN